MGRTLGAPVQVDENTLERNMGYYASVQVDIDLSKTIPDKILVEVEDKNVEFWQESSGCKTTKILLQLQNCWSFGVGWRHLQHEQDKGGRGKEVVKETNNFRVVPSVTMESLSKSQKKKWKRKQNLLQGLGSLSEVFQKGDEASSNNGVEKNYVAALEVITESPIQAQGKDLNVAHHLCNEGVENSATVGNELATFLASQKGVKNVAPVSLINHFTNLEEDVVSETQEIIVEGDLAARRCESQESQSSDS
ncbi:hypothetical protein FRX31_026944 [Thalictrum thalictroides]|uniref:Uncharacterized protein n=1 Tax=Thalictrum thalictroides TaxID=46969 RepID=A0A7J6VEG7_THATH|nr:hypothetical protein FRX31_026944 [Thalictrum thalictroides]